jgi:hypothetical protein
MTCPVCGGKTHIVNSRANCDTVRRRRECKECSHRFTTREIEDDIRASLLGQKKPQGPKCKPVVCVETGATFQSATSAAKALGLNQAHVSSCCRGARKSTGNLHFKFLED